MGHYIYIKEQSAKIAGGFYKYFDNLDDCQEYMDEIQIYFLNME